MQDYKNIKRYKLSLSESKVIRQLGGSESGVNAFLRAFEKCEVLTYRIRRYHELCDSRTVSKSGGRIKTLNILAMNQMPSS